MLSFAVEVSRGRIEVLVERLLLGGPAKLVTIEILALSCISPGAKSK